MMRFLPIMFALLLWSNVAFAQSKEITAGSGTPGGSDTQVQYNDGGGFGGSTGFVYDAAGGDLTVPDNVEADGFCDENGASCFAPEDVAAVGGSDTQVQFNDNGSLNGSSGLLFDSAGGDLTVGDNVEADGFCNESGANCTDPDNIIQIAAGVSTKTADYTFTNSDCKQNGGDFIDFSSSGALSGIAPDGSVITTTGCQIDFGMRSGGTLTIDAGGYNTTFVQSTLDYDAAGGSIIYYGSGTAHVLGGS